MASDTSADSPFNAKQVVFLFMAATVVAVVVFLCGVLVGQGVPLGGFRGQGIDRAGFGSSGIDALPPPPLSTPSSEPSAAARNSEDLTYPSRLSGGVREAERVDDGIPKLVDPVAEIQPGITTIDNVGELSFDRSSTVGLDTVVDEGLEDVVEFERLSISGLIPDSSSENSSIPEGSYVAQVIALKAAATAQRIAQALVEKGFQAFVVEPFPDDPVAYYRVRVGPFVHKADAERILERLRSEEGFIPYIVP